METNGVFTVDGGEIKNNTSAYFGDGLFLGGAIVGNLTISDIGDGGSIYGNTD
jgi:hypothetical protein